MFCPPLLHCNSIKRHMLLFVIKALTDCHSHRGATREEDISCLDATNFLFMHGGGGHTWKRQTRTPTHAHNTELIDLLWRVRKVPASHFSKMDPFGELTLQPPRPIPLLSPTSSQGSAHPAGVTAHSAESGATPNTCFCHKLRVSFLLLLPFFILFFYTSRKKWGKNGSF